MDGWMDGWLNGPWELARNSVEAPLELLGVLVDSLEAPYGSLEVHLKLLEVQKVSLNSPKSRSIIPVGVPKHPKSRSAGPVSVSEPPSSSPEAPKVTIHRPCEHFRASRRRTTDAGQGLGRVEPVRVGPPETPMYQRSSDL